ASRVLCIVNPMGHVAVHIDDRPGERHFRGFFLYGLQSACEKERSKDQEHDSSEYQLLFHGISPFRTSRYRHEREPRMCRRSRTDAAAPAMTFGRGRASGLRLYSNFSL